MSVVDGRLKVYGVDDLRIADGSIMPRITAANTMAPCVIIGERGCRDIAKRPHYPDIVRLTSRSGNSHASVAKVLKLPTLE
jgi:choline dehydrogenase-like flavoprotein